MNLSDVAKRYHVHYQTAYRWVKNGEIEATKVGSRYRVSDAAIQAFDRRRAAQQRLAERTEEPVVADSDEDLAFLRRVAGSAALDATPTLRSAAALITAELNCSCVVRLLGADGSSLEYAASSVCHDEPPQAAAGVFSALAPTVDLEPWATAARTGEPAKAVIVHGSAEWPVEPHIAAMIEAPYEVTTVVVPIVLDRTFVGGVAIGRFDRHINPSEDELGFVRSVMSTCGLAVERSRRFESMWELVTRLQERVRSWSPADASDELAAFVRGASDASAGLAVFRSDGGLVDANEAVEAVAGCSRTSLEQRGLPGLGSEIETHVGRTWIGEVDTVLFDAGLGGRRLVCVASMIGLGQWDQPLIAVLLSPASDVSNEAAGDGG